MKPSELSELHVRKIETPGRIEVIVTHLPSGESITEISTEAEDRLAVKKRAYRKLAKLLTEKGL